jgi:2-polyprenyl-3-methyl-5-hydroxy-6-metoxy-1,4-benzoquinol methylase
LTNELSATWFETFLAPETAAPIDRELDFIRTHLPLNGFPRLLDIPCGIGRPAIPLARLGYNVLGIDRSEPALFACAWFDRGIPPSADHQRMQLLFEKRRAGA